MTSDSTFHDHDAEPPTPDGEKPDVTGIETDDPSPAGRPDPEPDRNGAGGEL